MIDYKEMENVIQNLNNYLDLSNYTEKQIANIETILATVPERINVAKSKGELDLIESEIVAELDAVLTIEEELEDLKYYYRDGLFELYDPYVFPAPSANAISDEAFRVIIEISKATTISQVDKLVEDFLKYVNNYLTLELLATTIEESKTTITNMVEEQYTSDSRVQALLTSYKTKLNSILTKTEIEEIVNDFENQYKLLRSTIESEKNQTSGKCNKFNANMIALTSAISLAVVLLRRKAK